MSVQYILSNNAAVDNFNGYISSYGGVGQVIAPLSPADSFDYNYTLISGGVYRGSLYFGDIYSNSVNGSLGNSNNWLQVSLQANGTSGIVSFVYNNSNVSTCNVTVFGSSNQLLVRKRPTYLQTSINGQVTCCNALPVTSPLIVDGDYRFILSNCALDNLQLTPIDATLNPTDMSFAPVLIGNLTCSNIVNPQLNSTSNQAFSNAQLIATSNQVYASNLPKIIAASNTAYVANSTAIWSSNNINILPNYVFGSNITSNSIIVNQNNCIPQNFSKNLDYMTPGYSAYKNDATGSLTFSSNPIDLGGTLETLANGFTAITAWSGSGTIWDYHQNNFWHTTLSSSNGTARFQAFNSNVPAIDTSVTVNTNAVIGLLYTGSNFTMMSSTGCNVTVNSNNLQNFVTTYELVGGFTGSLTGHNWYNGVMNPQILQQSVGLVAANRTSWQPNSMGNIGLSYSNSTKISKYIESNLANVSVGSNLVVNQTLSNTGNASFLNNISVSNLIINSNLSGNLALLSNQAYPALTNSQYASNVVVFSSNSSVFSSNLSVTSSNQIYPQVSVIPVLSNVLYPTSNVAYSASQALSMYATGSSLSALSNYTYGSFVALSNNIITGNLTSTTHSNTGNSYFGGVINVASNQNFGSNYGVVSTRGIIGSITTAVQNIVNVTAGGSNTYAQTLQIKPGDVTGNYYGGAPSNFGADLVINAGNVNQGSGNSGSAQVQGYGGNVRIVPGYAIVSTNLSASNRYVESGKIMFYNTNTNSTSLDTSSNICGIFDNIGRFGVGLSNPQYTADVNGTIRGTGYILPANSNTFTGLISQLSNDSGLGNSTQSTFASNLAVYDSNVISGFGSNFVTSNIQVNGNITASANLTTLSLTGSNNANTSIFALNDGKSYIQANNDLVINRTGTTTQNTYIYGKSNTGFVGINNQNPVANLDVTGTVNISSNLMIRGALNASGGIANQWTNLTSNTVTTSYNIGNIPQVKMSVDPDIATLRGTWNVKSNVGGTTYIGSLPSGISKPTQIRYTGAMISQVGVANLVYAPISCDSNGNLYYPNGTAGGAVTIYMDGCTIITS